MVPAALIITNCFSKQQHSCSYLLLCPLLQGFLTMAFLVETLLMGMHKKPNPLDSLVHVLLTGVMITCVAVCGAEIAKPDSFLLAVLRPMVVFFQGTWFWHVGAIMFRGE
jgi:hypothetical protein